MKAWISISLLVYLAYYLIAWLMSLNASTPVFLQLGNWIYPVIVIPLLLLAAWAIDVIRSPHPAILREVIIFFVMVSSLSLFGWIVYWFGGWLFA